MAQYGGEEYRKEEQYGREEYRKEEQYGGEEYRKEEGRYGDGYDRNPLHSTATGQHEMGGMGSNMYSTTAGQDFRGDRTTVGMGGGQGYEEGKHGGAGGMLRRSGSGGSSSSEDDGEGGRRKKKGVMERMRGGDHGGDERKTSATVGGGGYGYEYEGDEGHEKKGLMEKIKDKLPGGHDQ